MCSQEFRWGVGAFEFCGRLFRVLGGLRNGFNEDLSGWGRGVVFED